MKRIKEYAAHAIMAILVLSLLIGPGAVYAASGNQQLGAGSGSGKAGTTLEVPIALDSEGQVSAIQFKLEYARDTLELTEVNKGAGLQSAFSAISNLENGKVVIGSLGSTIGSGTQEVVRAVFRIKSDATPGQYEVRLADVLFSDSDARNLTSEFQVAAGTVTVVNPDFVYATGLTVAPTALSLTVGGAAGTLTATVIPANATNKHVTWSSSDAKVATVVNGLVTPVGVGTATITAAAADGNHKATSVVNVQADSTPSSPVQPGTPTPQLPGAQPTGDEVEVLVNGKAEKAGTATTREQNGQQVTTVAVDAEKLQQRLESEGDNPVISVQVANGSDIVIGELDGRMVKNMELRQAVVEIKTEQASYTLPAKQINIEAIRRRFGTELNLQDIRVQIEIAAPSSDTVRVIEDAASNGAFTLVVPPLNFKVNAVYGDRTEEITSFDAYVERTIAIPEGVDPQRISTGVVMEPDGTVRHVPTRIVMIDGRYVAQIRSLTNSTYSVIWHQPEFRDMEQHWAKEAVGDMGARLVVSGAEAYAYQPDRDITRAEFAAVIVRALGLKLQSEAAPFSDVQRSDWYSGVVQTAYAYNLISGFEDGTFRPTDRITREQAMMMMAKAMDITQLTAKLQVPSPEQLLRAYSDSGLVSDWAASGVAANLQAGIVTGRTPDRLAPQDFMTRAEVAVIVQRLLQQSGLI